MKTTTWKEFSKNTLTHSGAHYLMAIRETFDEQGYARLSDVAKRLKISKGSLSTSLKPLIKKALILEDENKHLSLSEKGKMFADNISNTYSILTHFLEKVLNIDKAIAEIDACKIEHLLSATSSNAMLKMTKALENNAALLKKLQDETHKFENCSLSGCKLCKKKLCL